MPEPSLYALFHTGYDLKLTIGTEDILIFDNKGSGVLADIFCCLNMRRRHTPDDEHHLWYATQTSITIV